ncbi:aldehyde-activating protein [bacterium]|nr:aldehyde-activating protein [bacterium]
MTQTYSGGCACGALRYQTTAAPIFENHCQCADCRRRSGTGHGSYLTFARRAEMEIHGPAREWRVAGDSGHEKIHAFCPTCGTPVYLAFAAMPDLISVHAGSLDDPALFRPQVVTYAGRACSWDTMAPELASFARMAPG